MKKTLLIALLALISVASNALPSVQLKDINGNVVNTAELLNDGKPFIISFFATWCKPCMRELEAINDNYIDWQEETGVKMILVSIDEGQNVAKVKPLVDSKGWDFQVLLDPNGDFKRAMNVQMVPSLFILDGEGNVIEAHTGYTDGSEENIIEILRKNAK
ncbi:MAG: TlpA family protein disulfide reductase [Paludibacteraceae bacterium]|nr:TlpA family protein disulfide reductase [Candidatus Colousia faecequi]MCQ2338149.1 TlpA family protein disulfide reductase [Paludibacteraceae bacterium]